MNHKSLSIFAISSLLLASAASATLIFEATTSNATLVDNGHTGATLTGMTPDLLVTHGNTADNNMTGFASTSNINALIGGGGLLATDTVKISMTLDSLSGATLRSNGLEFGLASDASFRPATDSLILGQAGSNSGSDVRLMSAFGSIANGTFDWNSNQAALIDGLTITLTADVNGYSFSLSNILVAGSTNPLFTDGETTATISGTFTETEFVDNFGGGHFYMASQQYRGTMVAGISSATIEINPVALGPVTLIESTFDSVANDTNGTFNIITNSQANGSATWDNDTGVLDVGTTASGVAGAISDATMDIADTGSTIIEAVFTVASTTGAVNANGMFFGFQEPDGGDDGGDEIWNNLGPAFGLVIDGGNRSGIYTTAPGGNNGTTSGSGYQTTPVFGTVTKASINDGFTVIVAVSSDGWSIHTIGLQDADGNPITGGEGDWTDVDTNFADFTNAMRVGFSSQRPGTAGTYSVNLTSIIATDRTDSDIDGMPDSWEIAYGLNKNSDTDAAADADTTGGADGLSNLQEFQNCTDPHNADTDGDGTNDGDEVANGTDPTVPTPAPNPEINFPFIDTDGDGYRDEAETAFGSDPNDPDSCPDHSSGVAKPNIVIIYCDDMGFGDMSAYSAIFNTQSPAVTPNMDALASEGVLFTAGHSSNAVCTPSRYAILTGKYNWREFDNITLHYGGQMGGEEVPRPGDVTIAEYLKTHGYDTAAFGKWHLGGAYYTNTDTRITNNVSEANESTVDWSRPVEHHATANGFDYFRGLAVTNNVGPYVYLADDRVQFWVANPTGSTNLDGEMGDFRDATNADTFEWLTTSELKSTVVFGQDSRASLGDPSYTQRGAGPLMIAQFEKYMADRNTAGDTDPFFSYVALYSPHKPWALTAPFIGSESAAGFYYGDWMREVDHRIGRIIDAIDNNGYENNTIVILSSDNGPENTAMSHSIAQGNGADPSGPLRGNKRDVWEAGTRVPFVVRWPGQAAPNIKISDPVWQGDIFATIAAYLEDDLPDTTAPDGESFLNLIHGQQKPTGYRDGIIVSAIRGDLGYVTNDRWKFIDSSGGGDNSSNTSWDSSNQPISNPAGVDQGTPKQLFNLSQDIGEDNNLIPGLSDDPAIEASVLAQSGQDMAAILTQYRTNTTAQIHPGSRIADNDGDGMPNSFEVLHNLDTQSPKDASLDNDGDGENNLDEHTAGTNPTDNTDVFVVSTVTQSASQVDITWPSKIGRNYDVEWSVDLENWHGDATYAGDGTTKAVSIDNSVITGKGFSTEKVFVRIAVQQ